MTIRAVFFDMGGTIETFWHSRMLRLKATPGIQERLASAGIDLHLTNAQLYVVVSGGLSRYHQWRMQSQEELPTEQIWRRYVLTDYSYNETALKKIAEDLMLYIETQYYRRKMRPEIPAVLEAIHNMGLKIGLISNVSSLGQVPTNLKLYGIREYFDPVVLSSEYGRRKPDPAIFHYAARLAGVPTSECVYIGDRISRDISGARKAGFHMAIQIQHDFDHGEDDGGPLPDATIRNMNELLDILGAEQKRFLDIPKIADAGQNPIRALLFDAGDILYFRQHRNHKFFDFLKSLSVDVDVNHAVEKSALTKQAFEGQINLDQYRGAILLMYGVHQVELIERGKQILYDADEDIHFFDGVKPTLTALKEKGYLLGVITDTAHPLYVKLSWFERGGFGHVWDTIICSRELGVCKPDPRIYQAALTQLGVTVEQAVFVGHRASELDGARAVGMQTIAFNQESTAKADYYIDQFSGLLTLPILLPVDQTYIA